MKTPILFLLALVATFQTGCVVGRRTMPLAIPQTPQGTATRGDVAVTSVVDRRVFQNKPSEPSTPSIDGDVNTMTAAQRASMIGRQRNGFGRAIGDISLPAGDSVPEVARRLVAEGLKHRGYRVGSGGGSASVAIHEFWAWMSPGAFDLKFKAKVECTVTLSKGGKSTVIVVSGYGENSGQVAKNEVS